MVIDLLEWVRGRVAKLRLQKQTTQVKADLLRLAKANNHMLHWREELEKDAERERT